MAKKTTTKLTTKLTLFKGNKMNIQCKKLYKTHDLHAHWLQNYPKVKDIISENINEVEEYAFGILCPSGDTIDYGEVYEHMLISTEQDKYGNRIWRQYNYRKD